MVAAFLLFLPVTVAPCADKTPPWDAARLWCMNAVTG